MTDRLTTRRLTLDRVVPEDWAAYFPLFSAEATSRYSDLPPRPSAKRAQGFVNWMARVSAKGRGYGWMVRAAETGADVDAGAIIGCVRLNSIDRRNGVGVIGYEFAEAVWGRGIATEAVGAVVAAGHGAFELHRLEAWTSPGNGGSDRVLEKNGFLFEGVQREKLLIARERRDLRLFGRLASDAAAPTRADAGRPA